MNQSIESTSRMNQSIESTSRMNQSIESTSSINQSIESTSNINYSDYFKHDFMSYYDTVDILDFTYNKEQHSFSYPCPCGDIFVITLDDMRMGEIIARCNSCSLLVRVLYNENDIDRYIQ